MIEYALAYLLVIICIYYNRRMSKDLRIFCMCCICMYIVLLFGLRYRVGIDTMNYMDNFAQLPTLADFKNIDWAERKMEPGSTLLCMICKSIVNDFWLTQLVFAGITNSCIFIFLYQQCKNPFVGVFVYFVLAIFYFSTEIMRESVAVGISLLNFKNFQESKWGKYYLFCLLSVSFHYSALITFLFPLVRMLKINIWYIIVCVGFIMIAPIFDMLNQLLTVSTIASRVDAYVIQAQNVNINFRIFFIIYLAIPALCAVILAYKYDKRSCIMKYVLLHLCFCCGVFAIPIIFSRFANYTLPFVIVVIANLLSWHKLHRYIRVLLLFVVVSSQILYYETMYHRWVPYVSVFNPIKIPAREYMWWYGVGQ